VFGATGNGGTEIVGNEHGQGADKQILDIRVFAPRSPEPKAYQWSKHLSVGDAADQAARDFGYEGGTPSLAKGDEVLDRGKQLVAAGVRDGDELSLVDTGGGV
jgi:hypothetical protein